MNPEASTLLSGVTAKVQTKLIPSSVACNSKFGKDHKFMALRETDAISLPSGVIAKARTQSFWSSSVRSNLPSGKDQNLIVLSLEADASSLPSGVMAKSRTSSLWPSSVVNDLPSDKDHSLMVLS